MPTAPKKEAEADLSQLIEEIPCRKNYNFTALNLMIMVDKLNEVVKQSKVFRHAQIFFQKNNN
jgi:hypothetical protein